MSCDRRNNHTPPSHIPTRAEAQFAVNRIKDMIHRMPFTDVERAQLIPVIQLLDILPQLAENIHRLAQLYGLFLPPMPRTPPANDQSK